MRLQRKISTVNVELTPQDCLIHFCGGFCYIMKEIYLSQGQIALVDDEYFEYLNGFKWYALKARNTFYAARKIWVSGKQKTILMHWEVMNGKGIDHIDGNGLNNQKSNLRFCTQSENCMNTRKYANKSSLYKGVSFFKRDSNWRAQIMINRKEIHLGYFTSEVNAAKAYNEKAIELFGEFANLNLVN